MAGVGGIVLHDRVTAVPVYRAGCHFKFWVADWFAQLNNKMGGDLKKIQVFFFCFFLFLRRGRFIPTC